jgi:hypothetical protein
MTETFHTRIPTLSDAELRGYLQNPGKYRADAVEVAMAELRRRGHDVPEAESRRIRAHLEQRDASALGPTPSLLYDQHGPRMDRIRAITVAILGSGLASAAVIYRLAGSAPSLPYELEPGNSKRYLRALEAVGGKANVLATQFSDWFSGLWHGRSLAFTVAWISVFLAATFWFATTRQRAKRP